MKKILGLTMTEVLILVLILAVILPLGVLEVTKGHVATDAKICISNLKLIDAAKEQWAVDFKKGVDEIPTVASLTTEGKDSGLYIKKRPACPRWGKYRIGALGEDPTCSYEDKAYPHKLP